MFLPWKTDSADRHSSGLSFQNAWEIPLLNKNQFTGVPESYPVDIPFELFFFPSKRFMQGTVIHWISFLKRKHLHGQFENFQYNNFTTIYLIIPSHF